MSAQDLITEWALCLFFWRGYLLFWDFGGFLIIFASANY